MASYFKIQKLSGTRIRFMVCPACQMEVKVDDRLIKGGSQACNMRLRADMAKHLKTDHPDSRFTRLFTTDDDKAAPQGGMSEEAIRALVERIVQDATSEGVSEDMVREMVRTEIRKNAPQELVIKQADGKTGKVKIVATIKSRHTMLEEAIAAIEMGFRNILLVGPAGSGKTTLARQLAECYKRPFGLISLSGGATEGSLLGRITSTGQYLPALFVTMYEEGGIFLLDEVDGADPNVLLVLNAALENGHLPLPARVKKPMATRHRDFILLAAANTFGTGADAQYVGRNQLDAAFLSRFAGSVLEVNYDEALERSLTSEDWYTEFLSVRRAANAARLRRVLGTRELLAGQKLLKGGADQAKVWARLTPGWTADERRKAQVPTLS